MQPKILRQVLSQKHHTTKSLLFHDEGWRECLGFWIFVDDGFSLVFRGGAVALESSGLPTVPNNLRSQTPDRSSTCSDNRRVRVSNWCTHKHKRAYFSTMGETSQLNCYFNSLGVCVCVWTQPDGAESVASVHSSDTASEKRAASRHTTNSGTPTISVSRASVSSGIHLHLLFCFSFRYHSFMIR